MYGQDSEQHQECEKNEKILVIDNGSGEIKAGFAGNPVPKVILPNSAGVPFGRKSELPANNPSSATISTGTMFAGNEMFSLSDYFCLRPHEHGLLVDTGLETTIWNHLFSKQLLNIADPSEISVLVTEHFYTPHNVRYSLTQMIFEEFGCQRLVISPSQQLIPFAFTVGSLSQCYPLSTEPKRQMYLPTTKSSGGGSSSSLSQSKKKRQTLQKDDNRNATLWKDVSYFIQQEEREKCCSTQTHHTVQTHEVSSSFSTDLTLEKQDQLNTISHSPFNESFGFNRNSSQLVVDVGHQSMWCVPMYSEFLLDFAAHRSDVGGSHCNSLMKQLLSYQQVNIERNELLAEQIKKHYCFVSLNYRKELLVSSSSLAKSKEKLKNGNSCLNHLYQRCLLPDYKNSNAATHFENVVVPTTNYTLNVSDGSLEFEPCLTTEPSLQDIMSQAAKDEKSEVWNQCFAEERNHICLGNERIRVPELLFHPSDYKFAKPSAPSPWLTSPKPWDQCGVAELVERSIAACPPILQPQMAFQILVAGGSSLFPNFTRRLYLELRQRFPESWPIRIFQLERPQLTAWIGGSVWASQGDNYSTFCISKQQYYEGR